MKSSFSQCDQISDEPLASVIIVTYNHEKYIEKCIETVLKQKYPHEVIIIDNGSIDNTLDLIIRESPDVKIILSGSNIGYGAANNVGADVAKGEILVFLNPDTYVKEKWLGNLINPLLKEEKVITTPKILTYDGDFINTCGNINHFTGLTFTRGLGQSPNNYSDEIEVSGISGACFALKKKDFLKLQKFDEAFFIYNEDSDFSWRAQLLEFIIKFVPESIVYHDYSLNVNLDKMYHLEKGRYMILRKYLSFNRLILSLPSLIIAEILTFGYALKLGINGIIRKIQAIHDGFHEPIKKIKGDDNMLFRFIESRIPNNQLISNSFEFNLFLISNWIFSLNYKLIKCIYNKEY